MYLCEQNYIESLRYFIELAYDGKYFHGWQIQPNAASVQAEVENALSVLLNQELSIVGAGRTDAGVHAKQLYAHFDIEEPIDEEQLAYKLNRFLPSSIAVKRIFNVHDEAHARFDAISRTYEYVISMAKNPFLAAYSYYMARPLSVEKMNQAAAYLIKEADFQCFSKSKTDVYTYFCTIEQAIWEKKGDKLIFTIKANRFLRNMVRAIVGTLLEVGLGKIPPERIQEIIESKDRGKAGFSVPAQGLFLTEVAYPNRILEKNDK